ncbi:MAG TPA: methyltransferase domain-containing protein [Pseudonocardia sp.]|nr:methyltransferase domain-containing protein [Pseudonocardia sp.]
MTAAERARARMVAALRAAGRLSDPAVEEAFRAVPRHEFLPELPVAEAYADEAVAVQRIDGIATSSASQPSMMAIMLEQLAVRPGDRVLEIGAGTGYNAALLSRIVGSTGAVTSVDIDAELIDSAARHLQAAGVGGVELVCADGALGYPPRAPYDRIVLTVGSSDVRPEWVTQLARGGRLLLPLALRGSQLSVALDLGPDGLLRSSSVRGCQFIRMRGIGAAPDRMLPVGDCVSMQLPDETTQVDLAGAAAALTAPGPVRTAGVALGPQDVWDGFGLWLALQESRAVRLLAGDDRDPGDDDPSAMGAGPAAAMFPMGAGYAGVALVGPGSGVALAGPVGGGRDWPRPAAVHCFGVDGPASGELMLAALAAWDAAGRPRAAGLRLLVGPHPVATEAPGLTVRLPSAVVTASWPVPAAPLPAPPR